MISGDMRVANGPGCRVVIKRINMAPMVNLESPVPPMLLVLDPMLLVGSIRTIHSGSLVGADMMKQASVVRS